MSKLLVSQYQAEAERIVQHFGLEQFQQHYGDREITKEDVLHYIYAVLHNPADREKYELNLKHKSPQLSFYRYFWRWVEWGKELMGLHLNYKTAEPYSLRRIDIPLDGAIARSPKPKLKADKPKGKIAIDEVTTLLDVPVIAWEYKLGNRSALEWVLDQYKEPRDPTIREKFNPYHFADYKEHTIDLLQRVCTVSIRTMHIIKFMAKADLLPKSMAEMLEDLTQDIPDRVLEKLPRDGAEQHDRYLYDTPITKS